MNKIKGILRGLIDLSLHKMSWCERGGMLIRNWLNWYSLILLFGLFTRRASKQEPFIAKSLHFI